MKQMLTTNWNFFKCFRLLIATAILVEAIVVKDSTLGAVGLVFGAMALFNTSCCGYNSFSYSVTKTNDKIEDVKLEEIK
jgi:hypothetical protein